MIRHDFGVFTQTLHFKQSLISLTAHHNQEDTERVSAMDELDKSNDNDVGLQKPPGIICYINLTSINDDYCKNQVHLSATDLFVLNSGRNSKTRYRRWKKCAI